MKNVRFIFVLLLFVNCTTDSAEANETFETSSQQPEIQTCINDLPEVQLTNSSLQDFDFIIYGQDYSVLHSQSILAGTDSSWIVLPTESVIAVVTNNTVYGQKIQLTPDFCDDIELEIDPTNKLIVTAE